MECHLAGLKYYHTYIHMYLCTSATSGHKLVYKIKTHDSESRGQEEAGRTQQTSELFTCSTALKFVNTLNKPP